MRKSIIYRYLGTNGVIDTPVHIEGAYYIRLVALTAEKGKVLTNGKEYKYAIRVPEEEVGLWKEVKDKGQS